MTNVLLTGSLESFIQLLGALFIFAVVLAATYLTTRWMGGMQRGRQNNKNLHVIETISVGNNKMISIVEVGLSGCFCWKRGSTSSGTAYEGSIKRFLF